MSNTPMDDHIASLDVFAQNVKEAVRGAYPSGNQPYNAVHALFLYWNKGDLDIDPAINHLRKTLVNIYGYHAERYLMDADLTSHAAERAASKAIRKFTEANDNPNTLLIVIYNGHADGGPSGCKMKGSSESKVRVDWIRMAAPLQVTEYAHVLVILDCCYASVAAIEARVELLAARGKEGTAPCDPVHNLTTRFSKILENSGGRPLSVAYIYGLMLRDVRGNKLEPSPIHIALGTKMHGNSSSICLARLGAEKLDPFVPKGQTVRVTVIAELEDPNILPNADEWAIFFNTLIPSNVKKICDAKAEAVYITDSITVEFSIPVEVWSVLRWFGPYKFGRFVRSRNLLLPGTETIRHANKWASIDGGSDES